MIKIDYCNIENRYFCFEKMLRDMLDFANQSPDSEILPADNPRIATEIGEDGRAVNSEAFIGYIIWYNKEGQEFSKYFVMSLGDLKRCPPRGVELFKNHCSRNRLCCKTFLEGIVASFPPFASGDAG